MWAKQLKDKKTRLGWCNSELRSLPFSFLIKGASLDGTYKFFLVKKNLSTAQRFNKTKIKNRCVTSLRSRSVLRSFRLSRIVFRVSASSGLLLGVKKSSW